MILMVLYSQNLLCQKKSWCLPMCQQWLGPSLSCASATRNFSQPTWRSSRQSGPNCEASMPAKNRENLYILESNEWRPYKKIHELSKLTRRKKTLEWVSSTSIFLTHLVKNGDLPWNSFTISGNLSLSLKFWFLLLSWKLRFVGPKSSHPTCSPLPLLFRRVKMSTPDLQISQRLSHLQKKVGTKIGAAESWSVSDLYIHIYIM